MFRITANYDDRHHPLQGDVRTVASVMEALEAMPDAINAFTLRALNELMPGERCEAYGFGVEYIVERI